MAESPSHRFGQIIGEMLEAAIQPILVTVATEHKLYLDSKRPHRADYVLAFNDFFKRKYAGAGMALNQAFRALCAACPDAYGVVVV